MVAIAGVDCASAEECRAMGATSVSTTSVRSTSKRTVSGRSASVRIASDRKTTIVDREECNNGMVMGNGALGLRVVIAAATQGRSGEDGYRRVRMRDRAVDVAD